MSFELKPVMGTVEELNTDLAAPASHEREENVIPKIKEGIKTIIDALGGYLSLSVSGNLNPISGETGEEVNIHIVSLSPPQKAPVTEGEIFHLKKNILEDEIDEEKKSIKTETFNLLNPENKSNEQIEKEGQELSEEANMSPTGALQQEAAPGGSEQSPVITENG